MKRVIDYTRVYKAKEDESVTRANIQFFKSDDLIGFDKVVMFEKDKDKLKGVEGIVKLFSKTPESNKK